MDFVKYMFMLMDEQDFFLHIDVASTVGTWIKIKYGSRGLISVCIISHSPTHFSDKTTRWIAQHSKYSIRMKGVLPELAFP